MQPAQFSYIRSSSSSSISPRARGAAISFFANKVIAIAKNLGTFPHLAVFFSYHVLPRVCSRDPEGAVAAPTQKTMGRLSLTILIAMALLANGGASRNWHASSSALRRKEGSLSARPDDIHFTECTSSGLPGGGLIEDICADLDVASCGNNIT